MVEGPQALDDDPPAPIKLLPLGILIRTTGLLKNWSGVLLMCLSVVVSFARGINWQGPTATVYYLDDEYSHGATVLSSEMKPSNQRLVCSATLSKSDIVLQPQQASGG